MTESPQLGFSFHPRWLSLTGSAEVFLRPLQEAGLSAVEFTLHPADPDWEAFPPLIAECQRMGLRCHFHAPYMDPYNVAGFSGDMREEVEALYRPAIALAKRFAVQNNGPTALVVHGARAAGRSRAQLIRDTIAFMEWLLSQNTGLRVAVENLPRHPGLVKIGTSHRDLIDIVEAAEILGVHPETVKRLCREGRLAAEKVHNTRLIHSETLDAFSRSYTGRRGRRPAVRPARAVV